MLRINEERLRVRFKELSTIGATSDGGVHRPAFSEPHLEARRWFLEQARQAGLATQIDDAGNHSAVLQCESEEGPTLLLGSHLDSVPYGGRFDGALGVLAALEVLQVVKENNIPLKAHLEAIDFTDEEGRFVGLMGSQALTGRLREGQVTNTGGDIDDFKKALTKAGLREESLVSAGRDSEKIIGYLELHVEQGKRLFDQGISIGVVTSIVGIRSFKVRFIGRADHAGTTAMNQRLDAAQGASAFTLAVGDLVMKDFPGCVATVGNMVFEPGAFNVVPQTVTVTLEFRAEKNDKLDNMENGLLAQASIAAERFGLGVETEPLERADPVRMDGLCKKAIAKACKELGLKITAVPSGAGHDAQMLAQVCPAGMIFVPSVDGFSHSSREFTEWEDCVHGANVLLHTTLILAMN